MISDLFNIVYCQYLKTERHLSPIANLLSEHLTVELSKLCNFFSMRMSVQTPFLLSKLVYYTYLSISPVICCHNCKQLQSKIFFIQMSSLKVGYAYEMF